MVEDSLTTLLAEALLDLVVFTEQRPDDATADDDVRALENVTYVLNQAALPDRTRLRDLLGDEFCSMLGWSD